MLAIGAIKTVSLLLDRAGASASSTSETSMSLTATAASKTGGSAAVSAGSIFSVNHLDATKLRIHLMERLGKAFDMDMEDFQDPGLMAQAIKSILSKMTPGAVREVEKSLGLDKLGVSLAEVLDAMTDPASAANRKLIGALRVQAGELNDQASGTSSVDARFDDLGRYSLAIARR